MIYKTKKSYYTIEYRFDKIYKVKQKGYRIVVNDLTFFCDYKEWITNLTESSTGTKLIHHPFRGLEEVEEFLTDNYQSIKDAVVKFKENNPNMDIEKLEELVE